MSAITHVRLQLSYRRLHDLRVTHGRQHVVAGVSEQAHQALPEEH